MTYFSKGNVAFLLLLDVLLSFALYNEKGIFITTGCTWNRIAEGSIHTFVGRLSHDIHQLQQDMALAHLDQYLVEQIGKFVKVALAMHNIILPYSTLYTRK